MSDVKHTPGALCVKSTTPAGQPHDQFRIENAIGFSETDGEQSFDQFYVNFCGYFGSYGPHLFAAAPRMLEVLRGASAWINAAGHGDNCYVSNHYEGDPGNSCNCGLESLQQALTEVIDAAAGEEQ